MKHLIEPLLELSEYNRLQKSVKENKSVKATGPSESQKAHICYALTTQTSRKGIYIASNESQARRIFEDFQLFLGDHAVFLPEKQVMLHDVEARSLEPVYKRIESLERMSSGDYAMVVTSPEAFVHKLISPKLFRNSVINVKEGDTLLIAEIAQKLMVVGYERVDSVDSIGQFSVRGGIIDIFSVGYENPIRIELFGDEVDSVRTFDALSQRSIDRLPIAKILPVTDLIYEENEKERIISEIENARSKHIIAQRKTNKDADMTDVSSISENLAQNIENDIDRLSREYYFAGIDRLIPFILKETANIVDYDKSALIFIDDYQKIEQRVDNLMFEFDETCNTLLEKGQILPESFNALFRMEEIHEAIIPRQHVEFVSVPGTATKIVDEIEFRTAAISSYQGHIKMLTSDISGWRQKKFRIIVFAGTKGRGERLVETLETEGIPAYYTDKISKKVLPGQVVVTHGAISSGFIYPSIGFVIVGDKEVFGGERKAARPVAKYKAGKIDLFTDLKPGDYVVHQIHGIGQYIGIQQLSVENVKRDYVKIRYRDDAFIYIPTNQMDMIQKYIGSEGKAPKINKLGGSEWIKTKRKVSDSLRELAAELVKLYAERQAVKGYRFSPDTIWQKQFEETFPYEETEDQIKCIEEIKRDMESDKPMDRLLCGDVGYGKTEVALRAVFKAAMEGKQVAYLVPTTVLAQQHFSTFKDRLRDFPVKVDVISRFRTKTEQERIVKDVKSGNIDILIGTHRIIQKDIAFKDLGLLVVDEEQRFGVSHKEKIKNMMPNVDVLTLTATPIPRTLHMSLSGIRDISLLEDPPQERFPVQTYVMEYNGGVVKDAINREIARNGQIFYLFNRVKSILKKAVDVQAMLPDAKVAIAHGQMNERQLEDVMYSFINKEFDVLICTTIIESGLDMPNVNTIIVEDADRMGLAQLYQLRGRVGRSNRSAYAYITYRKNKILSEIAEKRLRAIREFTDFGSGFKISMRDLELRGAGNLLGAEQHGHLEAVGYDMYCRLLDQAVRLKRGEKAAAERIETSIDINVSAYIDSSYIPAEDQRIEMYKKIAAIEEEKDIIEVRDEMIDRFGDIPTCVSNIIKIAVIKANARKCGFVSVQEKKGSVVFTYGNEKETELEIISKLMDRHKRQLLFTASKQPYLTFRIGNVSEAVILDEVQNILEEIIYLKSQR